MVGISRQPGLEMLDRARYRGALRSWFTNSRAARNLGMCMSDSSVCRACSSRSVCASYQALPIAGVRATLRVSAAWLEICVRNLPA